MEETQQDSPFWAWPPFVSQLDDNITLPGDDFYDDPWVPDGGPFSAPTAQHDDLSLEASPFTFWYYDIGIPTVDSQSSSSIPLTPDSCANIAMDDQYLFAQGLTYDLILPGVSSSKSPVDELIQTPPAWSLSDFGQLTGIPSPPYTGPPMPLALDMPIPPLTTSPLLESHSPDNWPLLYDNQLSGSGHVHLASIDFNSPMIYPVLGDSPLVPEVSTQRSPQAIETPTPDPIQQRLHLASLTPRPRPRQGQSVSQARSLNPRMKEKEKRRIDLRERCGECGKGHQYKALRDRHIRAHHPELAKDLQLLKPPSVCPECGRSYVRSDHLYRHGVDKHGWPPRKKKSRA